jgi:O-acetyl-ADP-ribose deacetylase (regulator of RNase III)
VGHAVGDQAHNKSTSVKIAIAAFPAMGTGFGGVPFDEAARQMAVVVVFLGAATKAPKRYNHPSNGTIVPPTSIQIQR